MQQKVSSGNFSKAAFTVAIRHLIRNVQPDLVIDSPDETYTVACHDASDQERGLGRQAEPS
jgi:hypothetical protein